QVLGTDELFNYLDRYDLELDPHFDGIMGRHSHRPWQKFINPENQHLVSEEAISFVGQLLRYDHQERLTARDAMGHAYFAPIRASSSSKPMSGHNEASDQGRATSSSTSSQVTEAMSSNHP
ncbi:unnamed protein product, partial [Discosporangium mesarthrocarpum]